MFIKQNNNLRGFIQIPILIAIIVGVLIVSGISYVSIKQYQNHQQGKIETERQAQELAKAQQEKEKQSRDLEIDTLKAEMEALKNKKTETIPQTIIKEIPAKNTEITAAEISQYVTGVVKISCGNTSGSGTLQKFSANQYSVVTNFHVVDNLPLNDSCLVTPDDLSGNGLGVFSTDSTISNWNNLADVAVLNLKIWDKMPNLGEGYTILSIENLNYKISSLQNCPEFMPVGSPVVIVGYPAFSRQQIIVNGISMGITLSRIVSNGIISGYDTTALFSKLPYKNYFISAKIDSGNSGGIAFSKNENGLCNLGIPTWLTIGNYETQGLVQNIHNVIYK